MKLGFLLVAILGFLVPLLAWGERKQSALTEGRAGPGPQVLGVGAGGLFHPLAQGLRSLSTSASPVGAAPVVAFMASLAAWSIVPFGGVYDFGGTRVSLAVADVDWGVLLVVVAGGFGAFAALAAESAGETREGRLGTGRTASLALVGATCIGLSLLGLLFCFSTLRPVEMVLAQDRLVALTDVLPPVAGDAPGWLHWLRLPGWGVFLQPLGFVVFVFGVSVLTGSAPFGPAPESVGSAFGTGDERPGQRQGLFEIARLIWLAGAAAWITTLYLGGWSVPFLTTSTLVHFVAGGFGAGFATGLILGVHVLVFFSKLVVVLLGLTLAAGSLPRSRPDQTLSLGTGRVVPLGVASAVLTLVAVVWLDGVAP